MKKIVVLLFLSTLFVVYSCNNNKGNPKPREYFRISFPEKSYNQYIADAPYTFKYPNYAIVTLDKDANTEPFWININFPNQKAKIHCSYKNVDDNLDELLDDSRTLVYKHVVKAEAIDEIIIEKENVYGILYKIKGNAATPAQFYVTDSVNHFLRASLYFNVHPNKDSLAPVIDFILTDIDTLINSIEWR